MNNERLYKMFKEEHPETIGEKDQCFDTDNYNDWLEEYVIKLETKLSERKESPKTLEQHGSKALHIADVVRRTFMQEVTEKLIKEIQEKRETIIKEKLKEIVGIEIDIKEEQKRRFKMLTVEYRGKEEIIYFNDGSMGGLRIVTFVRNDILPDFNDVTYRITQSYSYY